MHYADPEYIEEESYASELLYLNRKAIKRMTLPGFISHLRSILTNHALCLSNYEDVVEFILQCVIADYRDFGIKKEDLFSKKIRGKTTEARKMAIIIIKQQLDLKEKMLSNFFGRKSRMVAFKVINEFKGMSEQDKNPQVRDFLTRHKRITETVVFEIAKIKDNQK